MLHTCLYLLPLLGGERSLLRTPLGEGDLEWCLRREGGGGDLLLDTGERERERDRDLRLG